MSKHQNQPIAASDQRRVIGLTGGIGMGKTTISDYLATVHHLPVLDADLYAREAVAPHSHVFRDLIERYGQGILLPDGSLDRRRIGQIIFERVSERLWLEQRIHPYVRDRPLRPSRRGATFTPQGGVPLVLEGQRTSISPAQALSV